MKLLDQYIIRKFVGTYVYSILILSFIIIAVDISEKIDDFTAEKSAEATLGMIVFDYYFNFLPYFINQFNALFVFISVIFFCSKMAARTEFVAILTNGVSYYRLLRPFIVVSLLICGVNIILTNWIIPNANKTRIDFENKYINHIHRFEDVHVHRQIASNTFAYMHSFNIRNNTAYQFSIDQFDNGQLTFKLLSNFARWDTAGNQWHTDNFVIREWVDGVEQVRTGRTMDTTLALTPVDFKKWLNNVETMNYKELNDYIAAESFKGSDKITFYQVEKYKRIAFPFATIILTIIGFAIASTKIRGGIGMHLGLGLLIAFSYILFSQMSFVYATHSSWHPLFAVWFPNILFTCIGTGLLIRGQR